MRQKVGLYAALREWLSPPRLDDEETTRIASLVNSISLALLGILIPAGIAAAFVTDEPLPSTLAAVVSVACEVGISWLARRGRIRLASASQIAMLWIVVTLSVIAFGGINGPVTGSYVIVIIVAGLLLGGRACVGAVLVSGLSVMGLFWLENQQGLPWGMLRVRPHSVWITHISILGTVAALLYLAVGNIRTALDRARHNERALAETNHELQALRISLEQQVQDRTRALQSATQELDGIFRALPDLYFRLARDGTILDYRAGRAADLYDSPLQFLGQRMPDVLPPEVGQQLVQALQDLAHTGQPVTLEYALQVPSGAKDFEARLLPHIEDQVIAIVRDVTERKRTEQLLTTERHLLRTLIDNVPDIIFVKDAQGQYVLANVAAAKQYGFVAPDAVLGKTVFDLYPRVLAEKYDEDDQHVIQTGQALINRTEPSMDAVGNSQWLLTNKSPLRDAEGQVVGLVGIARNVTEIKRTDQSLHRQTAQLALLSDLGSKIAATLEVEGVLSRAAYMVQQSFGYHHVGLFTVDADRDALVMRARSGDYAHLFPPDHRIRWGQGMVGWVAQTGERLLANDVRAEPHYINLYPDVIKTQSELCVPIRVGGETVGVLDVQSTDRGAFDESDVMALETLANQIAISIENARLYGAVRQHALELEARNEELDAFAHTVAHDLKGPLNIVLNSADLLQDGSFEMAEEDKQECAQVIWRNSRKMSDIIESLLLLAGVHKMEVELDRVNMGNVLREAVSRLGPAAQEGAILVPDTSTWPPAVGFEPWIEEVWVNYLGNACQYGGRPARIEVGANRQADGMVRFWVRDNGPGIVPEDQARLFRPFTRLDQVKRGGHGLGLSIVRRIVERLDGQVGVESEGVPGKGSLFFFTLPPAKS